MRIYNSTFDGASCMRKMYLPQREHFERRKSVRSGPSHPLVPPASRSEDPKFCQVVAVDSDFGVFTRAWCMATGQWNGMEWIEEAIGEPRGS